MAIKKPIPITFNLDSHQSVQSVCAVIHIDDKNTETLDLSLMQGGEHIAVSPNSTVTARFVRVKNNTLISDDIACTVQENGNIYIPIDNAAAYMLVGEIKIEVNIVDENDVLTMQFPLVIRVNNTILADAEICPISKGTIPELIDNAQETADNAQQAADSAQAAASTAQQTANSAQTAANSAQQTADNAMAGLGNKQDTLTAGENITIEGNVISAEGGAQIVSGVVNANGTITFTDSEGNSFTTSGESVIGPQGEPGQDYVLTAQDKTDIANIVLSELPTTETVNFYNYTGELLHSYTANEIAELTELPEAPTVQGMTFQNWNWSLSNIKSWVQNHDEGSLPVGAVFVTDDGHTRIYMHLREPKMASTAMPFCIQQMAGTVVIDWGDNSQPETITAAGIYSHLWQVNSYPADVMIDIEYVPSGSIKLVLGRADGSTAYGLFNNETYYASCVEKVEYGTNTDMLIYSGTFKNCSKLKSINIPSGFTSIDGYAFYNCTNLALTVLPDGITSINDSAFSGCTNLALTVLPDGITRIGSSAFNNCTNLALTVLPDGITSIDGYAFYGCTNLALTVLPDSITSIGSHAFYGCTNLALTVLPDGITSINDSAFSGCTNLALTVLPDSITSIYNSAFYNCTNLALTVLPDGITSIYNSAFQNCANLALTVLPDGITSIYNRAFQNCTNLALTVLPDGITSIGSGAFQNCTNLALTVLPDGITSIGSYAFYGCISLYFIDLTAFTDPQAIPTLVDASAFQNIPATAQFIVANQEMYDVFTTATNWSKYASKFVIEGANK